MICFNSIVNSTRPAGVWLWITVSLRMIVSLAARWVFKNISLVLAQELDVKDRSSSVQVAAKDQEVQSRQLAVQLGSLGSRVHTRKAVWCTQHRCKLSATPKTVYCSITVKEWVIFLTAWWDNQHHHILARNLVLGPVSQVVVSLLVGKRFNNKAQLTTKAGFKTLVLLKWVCLVPRIRTNKTTFQLTNKANKRNFMTLQHCKWVQRTCYHQIKNLQMQWA